MKTPERPEEKTFSITWRYVTTQHADAAAYKGHVVVTMPSDREWMSPRDARKFAAAILAAAERQELIRMKALFREAQANRTLEGMPKVVRPFVGPPPLPERSFEPPPGYTPSGAPGLPNPPQ